MGSSVSISCRSISNDDDSFPTVGLKVEFFKEFLEQVGVRHALKDFTTADVCEKYVKPFTQEYKCSYCQVLNAMNHPAVDVASVYVSHAWGSRFLDVMDTLLYHFRDDLNTVVWFDLFSMNQHKRTSEALGDFLSAIQFFGRTVMVITAWAEPLPLTRTWCLWEIYCTISTGASFEIALDSSSRHDFIKLILKGAKQEINRLRMMINVEKSQSKLIEDKERIFEAIRSSIGLGKLNELVFECIREWIDLTMQESLELNSQNPSYYHALAEIGDHISLAKGCPYHRREWELKRDQLGDEHPETITALFELGQSYFCQGEYQVAEQMYRTCFSGRKKAYGLFHVETLTTLGCIAMMYRDTGRLNEAKPMYEECVRIARRVLNPTDQIFLSLLHGHADICRRTGDSKQSERIFEEIFQLCEQSLRNRNKDLAYLRALEEVAYFFDRERSVSDALPYFIQLVDLSCELLGEDHPRTLSFMNELGERYQRSGHYNKAEKIHLPSSTVRKEQLGEKHGSLTQVQNDYYSDGKYDEENEFKMCVTPR